MPASFAFLHRGDGHVGAGVVEDDRGGLAGDRGVERLALLVGSSSWLMTSVSYPSSLAFAEAASCSALKNTLSGEGVMTTTSFEPAAGRPGRSTR